MVAQPQRNNPPRPTNFANIYLLYYVNSRDLKQLERVLTEVYKVEHAMVTPDLDRVLHAIYINWKLGELKLVVEDVYGNRPTKGSYAPFLIATSNKLKINAKASNI